MSIIPFNGEAKEWNYWSIKFLARATLCQYREIYTGKITVPKESDILDPTKQKDELKARKMN